MEVRYYRTRDGKEPFKKWFYSLKDNKAIGLVRKRINNLTLGNLGDYNGVGKGIIELRVHYGSGFRIYCGMDGPALIILLCGGDKSSQTKDIKKAKEYWNDYNS